MWLKSQAEPLMRPRHGSLIILRKPTTRLDAYSGTAMSQT